MIIKPIGNVELPRKPRRGMDGLSFNESVYRSIQQLRDRVFVVHNPPRITQNPNPFEVTLFKESGSWKVTVADGYVNERIPGGTGDALATHFPNNIKDGENRAKFTVADGQQVSLIVEVDEDGKINPEGVDDAVRVAIETIDETSTHFEPKIGDASTGVAGVYHYKLATIEEGDTPGVLELKPYLAGSHISHFRELPKLINTPAMSTTGVGRIVKEYDKASNQYRFRSISKSDGQLRVEESGDNVTVRGNGKSATIRYQVAGSSATDVATFTDGLFDVAGTLTIPIPAIAGKNVNLHVRSQAEGTDPDGWVNHNVSAKTLCFRNGLLAGTITQADPDALTEICTDIEVSAPGDLISLTCSDIDPVS